MLPEANSANLAGRQHRLLQLTGPLCWMTVVNCDLQRVARAAALHLKKGEIIEK